MAPRSSTLPVSLLVLMVTVDASHFRGGLVYWKTLAPITNNGSAMTLSITQRFAWRRSYEYPECDESLIASGQLMGDPGYFYCRVGCDYIYTLGSVQIACTDFSIIDDWMVGEHSYTVSMPYVPIYEASFSDCCWIGTLVIGSSGSWAVRPKFNFGTVISRRTFNASPKTKMPPILNLLYGCNHTVTIPVLDEDGDDIRCRWASYSLGECADVCNAFPGASLDERNCTLQYSATSRTGLYAVAIQIEDFYDQIDNNPFSSVPLQFLVNIYLPTSINDTCYSKPTFAWPTRRNGACVAIPLNTTFSEKIIAQSADISLAISDIQTQSPIGLQKSALTQGSTDGTGYITITWTPLLSQVGSNIFCFVASDSRGASSDQNCITFSVGTFAPSIINGSQYPVGRVYPNNNHWSIQFDIAFTRPSAASYIRFHNSLGDLIFVIDTANNNNVQFPSSANETFLNFSTTYKFAEKKSYYITLDNGVVRGFDGCGPESVGVLFDPTFWSFSIIDITPPVLTFVRTVAYSNGSATLEWTYDESTRSTCLDQGPNNFLLTIACNNSITLTNLPEGYHTLYIQATDDEGNSKQYHTSWYVDLTPPTVQLYSYLPTLTNRSISTFYFYCSDFSPCSLRCAVNSTGDTPIFTYCSNRYTTSLLPDGQYTLYVYAIDAVGNEGSVQSYTWTIDSIPPTITAPSDVTRSCGSPYDPTITGIPIYADNFDTNPTLKYADSPSINCQTIRTWTVTDHAGSVATAAQTITFIRVIPPTIGGIADMFIPCGETDELTSSAYAIQALKIDSPCGRKISINYTDSVSPYRCGIVFTRQWVISDDCGSVVRVSQKIDILAPIDPDYPANGQTDIDLFQALGWPAYPGSLGYDVYLWSFGGTEPNSSTAMLPVWQRQYRPRFAFPPNTQILWRVRYKVSNGTGTIDIPGPIWGFQTLSFADLQVTTVTVPPTAFSGASFTVTWTVDNIGNVSTSLSTSVFYDAVYLSRNTMFVVGDATLKVTVRQERYVDQADSYTSTAVVSLQPSDLGRFYVFVVVDLYTWVRDYSKANNRLLSTQSINVQLTPPPNLIVTSAGFIGILSSGQTASLRYSVQNNGIGITAVTTWMDAVFISPFEQRNSSAKLLMRIPHNGALASGSQYTNNVVIAIPNAIFGDYYVTVSADFANNVFENNNEDDNDLSTLVSITLSPYPDLAVSNISCQTSLRTGDNLIINVTVVNMGFGSPFEYYWTDGVWLTATSSGITYFTDVRQIYVGQQLIPSASYAVTYSYRIPAGLTSGEYNVTTRTDMNNEVFEYQSKANNQRTIKMFITQELPDLAVSAALVSVFENSTGNYLLYNATIRNIGVGSLQTNSWQSEIVLDSQDGTVYGLGAIRASEYTMTGRELIITNRITYIPTRIFGNYTVKLRVDNLNQILESDKTNNYAQIGVVTIFKRSSDLTVVNVTAPSSAYSGDNITVWWTVTNIGLIATDKLATRQDEVSLMSNGLIRTVIAEVDISTILFPGQSYERQAIVSIPLGLVGTLSLEVTTVTHMMPSNNFESDSGNNKLSQPITIKTPPSPDLKPLSCSYEIDLVSTVRILSVSCNVQNNGNTMRLASTWSDHVSLIDSLGADVIGVDKISNRKLVSGEVYTNSYILVIPPTVNGYYQLKLEVDSFSDVSEVGGENNNILIVPQRIFIPAAPTAILTVSFDFLEKSTFLSGSSIVVNCTVVNTGTVDVTLSSWTDSLYLFPSAEASRQQVLSSGFQLTSIIQNRKLASGASYKSTFQGLLPYFSNEFLYVYLIVDSNGKLQLPSTEHVPYLNNSILIQKAPLPDLEVVVNKSVIASVQSGLQYNVSYTVFNQANVTASGVWYDSVYLSKNNELDPFDIVLKSGRNPTALNGMSNYTQFLTVMIPYNLPSQSYFFIAASNVRRTLIEQSYENNADYKPVTVQVLPAVDMVVNNVNTDKQNVTYGDLVKFDWKVGNNGSLSANGRKCDSVYLSRDELWDINDLTIVDATCDSFNFGPGIYSMYTSSNSILPVAAGFYSTIVRSRSNLVDLNLANNIGVSETSLSISPPGIALDEVLTVQLLTNQQLTLQITGITTGLRLVLKLVTDYRLAYHSLYIKRNTPPKTNDYDYKSSQAGTTKQRVVIPATRTGSYYLLLESYSAVPSAAYQITLTVSVAKFEISSVFPNVIPLGQSTTLTVAGNLFGSHMQAYLTNTTYQIPASRIYAFTPEEAFITFDSSFLSTGNFTLRLVDPIENRSCDMMNAVRTSNVVPIGKFQASIITPVGALRAGTNGLLQVKIGNAGNSDIDMGVVVLSTEGNSKVVSTDANTGALPSSAIAFIPTSMNKPPTVIVPLSTAEFSFNIIPNDRNFIGVEGLHVSLIDDTNLLDKIHQLVIALKAEQVASEVWNIVIENVNNCLMSRPNNVLSEVSGLLTQHYDAFHTVDNLVEHLVEIANGIVPPVMLVQSVDLADDLYSGPLQLKITRDYYQQITIRRSTGLFGKGWSSVPLELAVNRTGNIIRLTKQRREFNFDTTDGTVYKNMRLLNDYIEVNDTSIVYVSDSLKYTFAKSTSQLLMVQDSLNVDTIMFIYDVDNLLISMNHSNGNAIVLDYNTDKLVSGAALFKSGVLVSQVFYTYNSNNLLVRVSRDDKFSVYEYTTDGDLRSSGGSSLIRTTFTYDTMSLLNITTTLLNERILQQVITHRECNGRVNTIVYPQNTTSSIVYGIGGIIMRTEPGSGLPISYFENTLERSSFITVGSDNVVLRQQFDQRSNIYTISDANDAIVSFKLNSDARLIQIGDSQGPYYNATYTGNLLTKIDYRDGTSKTLTYNNLKQLTSSKLRDGTSISYTYDNNQRVSSKQTTEGRYTYTLSSDGRLYTITSPDGSTSTVEYNTDGLPITVIYPDDMRLNYEYNECNLRKSITSSNGYNCTYAYDDLCRLTSVSDGNGSLLAAFTYGSDNTLLEKRLGNGMRTQYSYEQHSLRLKQLLNFSPNGTILSSFDYAYDEFGYRIETKSNDGVWTYKYDAVGQLVQWTSPQSDLNEVIEYDAESNRRSKQSSTSRRLYSSNTMNQYTSYGNVQNFTYDSNGNTIQKTKLNGKRVDTEQFVYNQDGRIMRISVGLLTCDYKYDIFGAVSSKTCSDGTSISYVNDPFGAFGVNVLIEIQNHDQKLIYHGMQHGLIVAQQIKEQTDYIFFLFDGDGSAVQTADESGHVVKTYSYDPFGVLLNSSTNVDTNAFRYMAQFGVSAVNETSNIIWMRNRLYDAEHGRFLSPDPLDGFSSPTNPYIYANNNPLLYKDPTGLFPLAFVGAGALVGGVYGAATAAWDHRNEDWSSIIGHTAGGLVGGAVAGAFFSAGSVFGGYTGYASSALGGALGTYLNRQVCGIWSSCTDIDLSTGFANSVYNIFPTSFLFFKQFPFHLPLGKLLNPLSRAGLSVYSTFGLSTLLSWCDPLHLVDIWKSFLQWIRSQDPNDIIGPTGYGDSHFLSASELLEFKIEFENYPNATAPAQTVRIEFVFDFGLDLATFKVGSFAFSNFSINSGFASNRFVQTVNTTDITGTYVYLQATPSAKESKIIWLFQTLDESGQPPADASIGFLPPNNGTTGQGYVTFRTNVRNGVDNLIKISANASIVFDENPPISTKTIFNTIDNVPPGKVNINATNVQGGILLQLSADDVGSGVKSFDLYNVLDVSTSPVLIKSDITSPYALVNFGQPPDSNSGVAENAIIYLDKNLDYQLTAVAIDFVENVGLLDVMNTVSLSAPRTCPSQCNGHGNCTIDECVCDANYYGISCNQSIFEACDPPIIELLYNEKSTLNAPVVVHMSASTPQDVKSISISLIVDVYPTDTILSKGQRRNDTSWYLADSDFGDVTFNVPSLYIGFVEFTVQAILVSHCGTTSRSISASFVVTTDNFTVSTTQTVDVNYTTSTTRTNNDKYTISNTRTRNGNYTMSTTRTYTDNYVSSTTHKPQVTVTGDTYWDSWSEWSTCSRTCDNGVRVRQRQCHNSSKCIGANVNSETCRSSTCPVDVGESMEGVLLSLSDDDVRQVLLKLDTFYSLIAESVNSYCRSHGSVCNDLLLSTNVTVNVTSYVSKSQVKMAGGYPIFSSQQNQVTASIKVIVTFDTPESSALAMSLTANVKYVDKLLLKDAISANLAILQQNLSIAILGVSLPIDMTTAAPGPTTTPLSDNSVVIAGVVGSIGGIILIGLSITLFIFVRGNLLPTA